MKTVIYIALLAILIPTISRGGDQHNHEGQEGALGIEALSPGLRDLLSKEMLLLQSGMMSIIPAFSSGNWGEIVTTADRIKDSYILKQSLTESQVKELHSVLPSDFIIWQVCLTMSQKMKNQN